MMSRRTLMAGCAASVVAATGGRGRRFVQPGTAVAAAVEVAGIGGPAVANAVAVRGAREQVTPFPEPPPPASSFHRGHLIRTLQTSELIVTLTFDDGPDPTKSLAIADVLKRRGYEGKATFFQVGINALSYPKVTRELFERGYEIGNHSKTHSTYSGAGEAAEIAPAQEIFLRLNGVLPRFFRSPGLVVSSLIQDECVRLGLANVLTDLDERDWAMPRLTPIEMNTRFSFNLHPGYICLRHDGGTHQNTVDAMDGLIDIIEVRGFRIVSLIDGLYTESGGT